MSKWYNMLIPHGKEIDKARAQSQKDNDQADLEQASAVAQAVVTAATVADLGRINYRNGFSVALGHAFAKRGAI